MKPFYVLAATGLLCSMAYAEEPATSWHLLGPAFSYHFSNQGSPSSVRNDGHSLIANSDLPSGLSTLLPPLVGETVSDYCTRFADFRVNSGASGADAQDSKQRAMSTCVANLRTPYQAQRGWNQTNVELGIEYDRRYLTGVYRFFGGAVVDSYYKPSAYFGSSFERNIVNSVRFNVDAGAMGMFWWRSVPNKDGSIDRRWVPALLPVLSAEDKDLGIGANLSFVPKIKYHGVQYTVDTLMLQISWTLKSN